MVILENEILKNHTSFKVGGFARYFVKVQNVLELQEAFEFANSKNIPYFILGNGTNLLVADSGFAGLVITLGGEFLEIQNLGDGFYKVGAAVSLGKFALQTIKEGFAGIHKLAGIPGTLGGAIYMNAGAYGQEIGAFCKGVYTYKNKEIPLNYYDKVDCNFGYRKSIFQQKREAILFGEFKLEPVANLGKTILELQCELKECMAKRKATQPLNKPNAGSTFKRLTMGAKDSPLQLSPGYYIEQSGLKGVTVGGAQVSELHGNFIINTGNATAKNILDLGEIVKQKVYEKFQIKLEEEIIKLGEF